MHHDKKGLKSEGLRVREGLEKALRPENRFSLKVNNCGSVRVIITFELLAEKGTTKGIKSLYKSQENPGSI